MSTPRKPDHRLKPPFLRTYFSLPGFVLSCCVNHCRRPHNIRVSADSKEPRQPEDLAEFQSSTTNINDEIMYHHKLLDRKRLGASYSRPQLITGLHCHTTPLHIGQASITNTLEYLGAVKIPPFQYFRAGYSRYSCHEGFYYRSALLVLLGRHVTLRRSRGSMPPCAREGGRIPTTRLRIYIFIRFCCILYTAN